MGSADGRAAGRRSRRDALRIIAAGGAAAATCGTGRTAWAQAGAFPNRLIRIVPFGAGGGPVDGIARIYGEKLHARWGQPVIVDPKPGASGTLAADAVAKAAPDGYTVMITLPLTHINNAFLQTRLPYDPAKDFEPLSELATGGPMLVTRADAPYANLKELAAYAKAHPNLSYGTWGIGSMAHLYGELLKRKSGIELTHVPYKAEAQALSDLYGGAIDFSWANPATARAQARAGKIKVLGVAGSRRLAVMPEVPTFTEQGFAGFDLDSWLGAYAPARTPAPILATWSAALREITRMPDVQAKLVGYGFEPLGNAPEEFRATWRADYPRVAELVKAAGVVPE